MFKVFISSESLKKICLKEMAQIETTDWFKLLTKQTVIYLEKEVCNDGNTEDPLFIFSTSYQICLKKSDIDYNDIITHEPIKLLENPQCAYLLDIEESIAHDIRQNYGLICESTNCLKNCSLTSKCKHTILENETNHTWKELLVNGASVPSNSLIIVDRYLFAWEKTNKCGCKDGVDNIKAILRSVLPQKLSCDYHVLILFDKSTANDRNYPLAYALAELENFKQKELKRPYNIIIELFSVSYLCYDYKDTHNRKIVSNYFLGSAEHLIKAFRWNGTGICDQDLRVECAYAEGLTNNSDPASKYINRLIEKIKKIFQDGSNQQSSKSSLATEYTAYNTATQNEIQIEKIQNRLIRK